VETLILSHNEFCNVVCSVTHIVTFAQIKIIFEPKFIVKLKSHGRHTRYARPTRTLCTTDTTGMHEGTNGDRTNLGKFIG